MQVFLCTPFALMSVTDQSGNPPKSPEIFSKNDVRTRPKCLHRPNVSSVISRDPKDHQDYRET